MVNSDFDPDAVGVANGNYFGFPFTPGQAEVVLLSVPWDVTASYGRGSADGPAAIVEASTQLDFYDPVLPGGWRRGIATLDVDPAIARSNRSLGEQAGRVIAHLETGGGAGDPAVRSALDAVNAGHRALNDAVYGESVRWLDLGKRVGVVGGDHSVPYGLIKALSERGPIGVLHIDAHADLRRAYEGFEFSHASIMYNVSLLPGVERIVQVGVRDVSEGEVLFADRSGKVAMLTDEALAAGRFAGATWDEQCTAIIDLLPHTVYISFDIDGLSPDNCPHTGTPVPGGLSFAMARHLLGRVARSGRRVAGFDLCEVAPGGGSQWDANVGARVLYRLCNVMLAANG